MYDLDSIYNYQAVDLCERVALEFIHHSVSENGWILNLLSLCCTTTIIPSFHLTDNSKKSQLLTNMNYTRPFFLELNYFTLRLWYVIRPQEKQPCKVFEKNILPLKKKKVRTLENITLVNKNITISK